MNLLQQPKDKRLLLAMGTAIGFFCLIFFVIFPWGITLSSQPARWSVAGLCIFLLFLCVVAVILIQEPHVVLKAYNEWYVARARKRGEKVPERRLSEEAKNSVRNKYPGLF